MRLPERLARPREIRRYDGLTALSCATPQGRRLVLVAEPEATERLARIEDAHARITSPHIPPVEDAGERFLVFACDARGDLEVAADAALASDLRAPYAAAVAFNELLMDAVEAAHAAPGGAVCFGALGARNVLLGEDGHACLFGAGDNFPLRLANGRFVSSSFRAVAPEVLLGVAPTPASDVYALHGILPTLVPLVDMYPVFEEAARGGATETLAAVRAALVEMQRDALAPAPEERVQSVDALRQRYRAIRALTPAIPAPDTSGLQALLRTWIRAQRAPRESAESEALSVFVDRAKRSVRVGSREAELARRGSLWRIWERLVDAHLAGGPGITRDGLVEAGWPDESVLPESASARVHVALSTLRKLGLRDCFVRHGERYRIAPGVELRTTD
ncbi:MAG: hypothetical protein EVA89_06655 [Sandaracinaceae bacterium]|nr:MAG: hypothetical protein EVA89_06655 [Sandaracinaceae bacterium]